MMVVNDSRLVNYLIGISAIILFACPVQSGVFEFADEVHGVDTITHPVGYTGNGADLVITVGISPLSLHIDAMEVPVRNVINTWNRLIPTTGNVLIESNGMLHNQFDFESVALHELGHCLGLGHPNLASESGLSGDDRNFTKATRGANNNFDLNSGIDGVVGSSDDLRGDDVNLHWFHKESNNPFMLAQVIDITTYSQSLDDLPSGDQFVVNGDRAVAELMGFKNTEAVMQQGILSGETRRTLTADDIATLRLAMSGLDRLAGTSDDYTIELRYEGITDTADIIFEFDNQASFAACEITGNYIDLERRHIAITEGHISLNTNFSWFFNDELAVEPLEPVVTVLANDSPVTVVLTQGENLTLAVTLDPGKNAGNQADYWVKAATPLGDFWLDGQLQFRSSDFPIRVFGGALIDLSEVVILNIRTTGWPLGSYVVTFAVDDNSDHLFDATFQNSVTFIIDP